MVALVVHQELLSALGNPAYNQLMEVMDISGKQQHDRVLETVELRFERRLGEEMSGMRREISDVRREISEMKHEISQFKDYVVGRMDAQFKWMVAMWLTQMIAMVGILAAILQLVIRIR